MGSSPRGLKVNNPGNIRISTEIWKGETFPSMDSSFKTFKSLDYGFRAMSLLLYNYFANDGCDTIRKIITRYAPESDGNNDQAYIDQVSSKVGVSPDRIITIDDFTYPANLPFMQSVVGAMAEVEQGQSPDQTALKNGYQMFVSDKLS